VAKAVRNIPVHKDLSCCHSHQLVWAFWFVCEKMMEGLKEEMRKEEDNKRERREEKKKKSGEKGTGLCCQSNQTKETLEPAPLKGGRSTRCPSVASALPILGSA